MGGSAIEGVRVANKRVAKFRTLESKGMSDEACRYGKIEIKRDV